MTYDQVRLFLAILTVIANVGAGLVVVSAVGARFSPFVAGARDRFNTNLGNTALPLTFLVASAATLGSLYLSEIAHLVPCRLCWFQRIAMYPLAVLFGIAWWRKDRNAWWYGLPIAATGAAISVYHYLIQWRPRLDAGACSSGVPCSAVYFREFGFMSIPYMALSGFLAIAVLCVAMRGIARPAPEPSPP